jgi:hypothetical protein
MFGHDAQRSGRCNSSEQKHVVEMDDEEFCVPDDVLEEASAAKYQMVPTKSKLRYQKELEIFTQWQTEIKGKDESSISAVIQC